MAFLSTCTEGEALVKKLILICDSKNILVVVVENCVKHWYVAIFLLDVNECSLDEFNGCLDFEKCKDIPGGFECICEEGYIRNGSICKGNAK